ncbi:hypothetical protein VFPPC_17924 [Pochonia chlamydosporia 170]|uniref:Uncharacterized protein n=1 Tax=Pochonia chlamydosporia 170 TaxID=1380566 RepID=A0A219AQ11_METCM|nr:hypothetical protein VFPPC_17924 [Pochonia chlamydosporia 170]OWT42883.1 hypothetical protein VFPPC_17924 [Pochonia chlamydosporia 170]
MPYKRCKQNIRNKKMQVLLRKYRKSCVFVNMYFTILASSSSSVFSTILYQHVSLMFKN